VNSIHVPISVASKAIGDAENVCRPKTTSHKICYVSFSGCFGEDGAVVVLSGPCYLHKGLAVTASFAV